MSLALIVNADDFGITDGVNRAIVSAHLAGNVTSTTLMVNMPAAARAVELARSHPALGVGWHVNLTLGRPISDPGAVPSLVGGDGEFHSRSEFQLRLLLGRIQVADVRRELREQFERFLSFGRSPTHIDSHQHVHVFPAVFNTIAEIAEIERMPVRIPWSWPGPRRRGVRHGLRSFVRESVLRRSLSPWRHRLSTNTGFCSLFDLIYDADAIGSPVYRELLGAFQEGVVELMVHPAEVDTELERLTRITEFSHREFLWLQQPELGKIAREFGYRLGNFESLLGQVY